MKDFLICIDSDGCVFDNMELKHKECFCPATVNVWGLQSVSRYAREAAEFVNLYSKTRGMNRFPAVVRTLELLGQREEAVERGYGCPDLTPLKNWIDETDNLSAAGIRDYCAAHPDAAPILKTAAQWSAEVDENIARIVHDVAPLPGVKETLAFLSAFADIVIVSATPHEAIVREWGAQGLLEHVTEVAGQEMGTKRLCIERAVAKGGYSLDHVLMVGDAPGDDAAAKSNGVLFYPIVPGQETESWRCLLEEAADRFHGGTYAGAYMDDLLSKFYAVLRDTPEW